MRPNQLKRTFSNYDEPFSDVMSNGDGASMADAPPQSAVESQPQPDVSLERDNKLLQFSMPSFHYALLDYTYRRVPVSLSAQLHGMFFLAESLWQGNDNLTGPKELTCYRRNLFSISGQVQLPRTLRYILTDQGEQVPIVGQELELSAKESVENNPVRIISVPWKTPAGAGPPPDEKPEREPTNIPLDLLSGAELDPDNANIPFSWKRLQFRIATANNGRRKELQQHFTIKLRVVATLSTGQKASLCEVTSGPIIVRGRSPRNFQAKREIPVGSGSISGRKAPSVRSPTGEKPFRPPTASVKNEPGVQFDPSVLMSPDTFDFKIPNGNHGAMTSVPPDHMNMPTLDQYASSSPDYSRRPAPRSVPAAIHLSLSDDEPKKRSPTNSTSPVSKRPRLASTNARPASFTLTSLSEHDESADQLYEYFPLGLDDWAEPVDAVYRPHVVHHINVPDAKAKAHASRSKRYFSSAANTLGL